MITGKEINRLALPAIISGIIEPVIALIDTAFVGQLGAVQLAGVGIASSFYLLLVWMLSQTKSAITAKVAKHFGSNTLDQIESLVPLALWLNLLLGLLVYLITNPFDREIFQLYGATGDVLEQAMCYYSIRVTGFPLVLGTMIIFGSFRGIQNTSWPMWSSMAAGAVNLVLDPILIFGVEGILEPMGVAGAAWASLVAQSVMFAVALNILIRKTSFDIWPDRWRHPELGSMLKLSGDLFVRTLAMNIAYYLGNRQATLLGDGQIAAHTIAMNIWLFSSYFIDGYAEAAMVLSGRLKGEDDHAELRRVGLLLVKVCMMIGTGMALIYALLYPYVGPFFSPDPVVQDLFTSIFWIVIASQVINGLAFAMDGIFNGLGDGRLMRNVLLVSTLLCFVPVILLGQESGWGLKGIWAAFFVWMVARGFPLFVSFIKRYPLTDVEVS